MVRDFQQLVPRKSPVFHTSTETLKVTSTCFRHVGVLSVIWTGYWWCLLANVERTPFLYCCLHKFTNPNQQNHRKYEQMYLVSRTSGKVNSSEKPEISLLVLYRMPFLLQTCFSGNKRNNTRKHHIKTNKWNTANYPILLYIVSIGIIRPFPIRHWHKQT